MFVQFIEGPVKDADELQRQIERWQADLAPGAHGWLGSTGGVTPDGTGFLAARFESAEAARRNSDRPEQSEWWEETSACFEGQVDFLDCDDVQLFLGGGSDDAGFVQVIRGRVNDVEALRGMTSEMDEQLSDDRPDVLGGLLGVRDDGTYAQIVYFSSEDEARKGEAASEGPPEEYERLQAEPPRFLDLYEPWLASA